MDKQSIVIYTFIAISLIVLVVLYLISVYRRATKPDESENRESNQVNVDEISKN